MAKLTDNIATKFYDPLYEVVVFSGRQEKYGDRNYYYVQGVPDDQMVTPRQFLSIVESYEFNRLNFLRQAGLAWLVYPSATHTRFSHSLGCWLLSEWACDNIFSHQSFCSKDEEENNEKRELVRLGSRLREFDWIEEFQLALLLHDIGHFPFSHVIENNDILLKRYSKQPDTSNISLVHEDIGCALIVGNNPIYDLFEEFIKSQVGLDYDQTRFLSKILRKFKKSINVEKIVYIISGIEQNSILKGMRERDLRLIRGLHELVSGVIDLDRIDHYHRDSHFVSIKAGEFNIHGLLNNMVVVDSDDLSRIHIQLISDGIGHAFQMLYAKKRLCETVFHNVHNLAYEVMLNYAINQHWNVADDNFRVFLPFYDDSQLMYTILESKNEFARKAIQHIRLRKPFTCVGKYILNELAFDKLGVDMQTRRLAFIDRFNMEMKIHNIGKNECFLRLDKNFGKSDEDNEWMDLTQILGEDGQPLSKIEDHMNFVEFIRQSDKLRSRTFWLFVSDNSIVKGASVAAKKLEGKRSINS